MIKSFAICDFEECRDLFIDVFNAPPWHDKWTVETAGKLLNELMDNKRFLGYTLWEKDMILGAIFCQIRTSYLGDEIRVEELFVSPDYQCRGHGKMLMSAVEKYAKENSCGSITLLTSRRNSAFKFYEHLNFYENADLAFMCKRVV